jgi:hypothetical protein
MRSSAMIVVQGVCNAMGMVEEYELGEVET